MAPLVHEMLRHVAAEMGRYDRVISHWPIFGPYLEAAMCIVLRAVIAAVSRQCGMVQVRHVWQGHAVQEKLHSHWTADSGNLNACGVV